MKITSGFAIPAYKNLNQTADALFASMQRLSSGERLSRPGDAPADYGISQNLRFQIGNADEARRNVENARNMVSSADHWLQVTQDMLTRMSELSIAANDGSKSDQDRATLNVEFMQLKEEIGRVAQEAKYNGVHIAGRDQVLAYDQDNKTFFFSQLDGDEAYSLPKQVATGLKSNNNQDFLFDPTKEYTLSGDGKFILYADSNNHLVRYDIETENLVRDASDAEVKQFNIDEKGRFFYARETSTGSGVYALRQQDVEQWSLDTTMVSTTSITDMASPEFQVFGDWITYLDTAGDIVSRNLHNPNEMRVDLTTNDVAFTTTAGQFAISPDGRFMADVPSAGEVRVVNMETNKTTTYNTGTAVTIADLTFSADNNAVMFVDSANDSIHRMDLKAADLPFLSNDRILHNAKGANGFSGVSLQGSSHRAHFRVHNGPDSVQESFLTAGDARLFTLGISKIDIDSSDEAEEAIAAIQTAIDRVSVQRARIGAQESRLGKTYEAMIRYADDIAQADAVIRDADIAKESSELVDLQVRYDAALALIAQAQQREGNVLRLLTQ